VRKSLAITGRITIHPQTPPSLFRPVSCYRRQPLLVHFDPERLPYKIRSCQRLGSILQHRTSSGAYSSVEFSIYVFPAFTGDGETHLCRDSSNSCPIRHYSLVVVLWGKHLFSPYSLSSSSSSCVALHRSIIGEKMIFFVVLENLAMTVHQDPQLVRPYLSLGSLLLQTNALVYVPGSGPSWSEMDLRKRGDMCPVVSLCAERFSDSPSGAIITFHDGKDSSDAVKQRKLLSNEKQL